MYNRDLIIGVITCLMVAFQAQAQTDSLPLRTVRTVEVAAARDFALDGIGNLYVLTDGNTVEKYDASGRKRAPFTHNRLGNISAIDASNALKILLWYPDFRTALFLDRNMTQSGGELDLIEAGFPEVRTVNFAADGNLWVYDEIEFKFRKITTQGTALLESQQLNQLFQTRLSFQKLADDGTRVIAVDTTQGFFIFDAFGQFQQQIKGSSVSVNFIVAQNILRWIGTDGYLHAINIQFPAIEQTWVLPENIKKATHLRLFSGGIAAFSGNSITIAQY